MLFKPDVAAVDKAQNLGDVQQYGWASLHPCCMVVSLVLVFLWYGLRAVAAAAGKAQIHVVWIFKDRVGIT